MHGSNVPGGLVMIAVAGGLLYAWWSGALAGFVEQLSGKAQVAPALAGGRSRGGEW